MLFLRQYKRLKVVESKEIFCNNSTTDCAVNVRQLTATETAMKGYIYEGNHRVRTEEKNVVRLAEREADDRWGRRLGNILKNIKIIFW